MAGGPCNGEFFSYQSTPLFLILVESNDPAQAVEASAPVEEEEEAIVTTVATPASYYYRFY